MSDQTQAIILGIVRHGIGVLGSILATHGIAVSGGQMDSLAGGVMVLIAVGWSAYQKTKTQPK